NTSTALCVGRLRPGGQLDWVKSWGAPSGLDGRFVATSASGDIFVAGAANEGIDFGGGRTNHIGGQDVFVLQLDSKGDYLASVMMGTALRDLPTGLSSSPSGAVNLTYFENNQTSSTEIRGFHFASGQFVLDYSQSVTGFSTQQPRQQSLS